MVTKPNSSPMRQTTLPHTHLTTTLTKLHIRLQLIALLSLSNTSCAALQLTTTSKILSNITPSELHRFLATPTNWPKIVASSHSVRSRTNRVDVPLAVGDAVEEVFGLPPLLPLSVFWECTQSDVNSGTLEFYSSRGVPYLAKDCKMKFRIVGVDLDDDGGYEGGGGSGRKNAGSEREDRNRRIGVAVTLQMEYDPVSPLTIIATPLLSLDNDLALKVLLPNAL